MNTVILKWRRVADSTERVNILLPWAWTIDTVILNTLDHVPTKSLVGARLHKIVDQYNWPSKHQTFVELGISSLCNEAATQNKVGLISYFHST